VQLVHGLGILIMVIGVSGVPDDPIPPPLTLQVVDIRAFGAVGDGVTDDRAAIQAAIDDAGGRPVYFPPAPDGWAISSPLRLRRATHLVGDHTPSYFPPNFRPGCLKALPTFTGSGMIEVLDKSLTGTRLTRRAARSRACASTARARPRPGSSGRARARTGRSATSRCSRSRPTRFARRASTPHRSRS
jgi:Pectate lyase superfamily protein